MSTLRTARRTALSVLASGAVAAASLVSTAPAQARPAPEPVPTARAAGIQQVGDAFMGWSAGRERTRANDSTAAGSRVAVTQTPGIDVSKWQGNVDWASYWSQGKKFAYVKATEGTTYQNAYFAQQYNGSYGVGMIRGAYHFALPDSSSGTAQADWFVGHGGGWSADGKTLPGVLDIEYNPYGATCYGLSQAGMVSWIRDFTSRYKARTGRDAVIYTTTSWWTQCTGNSSAFGATNPLWVARYNTTVGTLPAGWGYYTFWQYTDTPLDQDWFNGDLAGLTRLALG
ncbi:lysozyme [Phycicoccus avicenniae]|uniref:lysozyme n=1 Tax=Phycicoccus avicenniae TaxID=2828860 RepID=UPI003D26B0F8